MTLLLLLATLALYLAGLARRPQPAARVVAMTGGMAALFAALVWPLEDIACTPGHGLAGAICRAPGATSFSLHMVQHLTIGWVAAPLLAWAMPWPVFAAALPRPLIRQPARWLAPLGRPLPATVLHGAMVWFWHLPLPYEAALRNGLLHSLEHFGFLLGGLVLWWMVAHGLRKGGAAAGVACVCLLITAIHEGMLGGLLTLGRRPLYASHPDLADQQLAGLIMWVPVGLVYLGAGALLAARMLVPSMRYQRKP